MLSYRIPILQLLFVSMALWTHTEALDPVHITSNLNCDESVTHWCAHLVLFEEDTAHNHDILLKEFFCTTENGRNFTWPPFYFGSIRDASPEYEFNYQLSHTCTSDGKPRCFTPEKAIDVSVLWDQYVHFHANVFNAGKPNWCPHPNDKKILI